MSYFKWSLSLKLKNKIINLKFKKKNSLPKHLSQVGELSSAESLKQLQKLETPKSYFQPSHQSLGI